MEDILGNPAGMTLGRGYSGNWADTNVHASISRTNENVTGIDFGYAVARGADSKHCKPVTVNGDVVIGISVRNAAIDTYNSAGEVKYAKGKEVAIGQMGRMLVIAHENAAEGDGVIAIVAQGGKLGSTTGGAAGAGRIAVQTCKWAEAVLAGEVGVISFNLLGAV